MTKDLRRMLFPMTLLLAACGGGGGGGSPKPLPSIQITSPVDGQSFTTGDRHITVTGAGANLSAVEVRLNGTAIPATDVSSTASGFTANVTLGNNANTIEVVGTNANGNASSGVISVTYPFASFSTFQEAAVVIGQADFTHSGGNAGGLSAATLSAPYGSPLVHAGKLYVGDYGNNRVLVYDSIPTTNGASAHLVLGEPDFTTNTGGATASLWASPQTVDEDSGKLFVAEYSNNRVLILNSIPTASSPAADVVVGQENFTSYAGGACTQTGLLGPESIFVTGGKLLVADTIHNRVLVWNSIPTSNGAPADLVLGQTDFIHCMPNAGSTVAATALFFPTDLWTDGTRLAIVDGGNNRVLIWNTFPTVNGAPADIAVGQADLTSSTAGDAQGALDTPYFVTSNGNQLVVADANNYRVMIWNFFPASSGALADVVLGQGDFGRSAYNDDDQDGTEDTAPTARTLAFLGGVALHGNQLLVSDYGNNRLLIFDAR